MTEDERLEQIVNQYVQSKLNEAHKYGTQPEEIEKGMNLASFIITVNMLHKACGDHLPTQERMIETIARLMDAHPNEARELCSRFIEGGWMNPDYSLSAKGQQLSGQGLEL